LANAVSRRVIPLRRSKNMRIGVPIRLDAINTNAMLKAPSANDHASMGHHVPSCTRSIVRLLGVLIFRQHDDRPERQSRSTCLLTLSQGRRGTQVRR
jgi:hypothetical protein